MSDAAIIERLKARLLGSSEAAMGDEGLLERAAARARRPFGRRFARRDGRIPELRELGQSVSKAPRAKLPGREAPRILVVSLRAWYTHNVYESVFAQSLRLRGAEVSMLTCGGGQPLCEQGWARRAYPRPCDRCAWFTDEVAEATGVEQLRLADLLSWGGDARDAPAAPPPSPGPADPAEAVRMSVPWMLKSTEIDADPRGAEMANDFAVSAAGIAAAAERALDDFRPGTVILIGGLFTAEHVIRRAALARGIKVVSYEMAPRENALIFSNDAPVALLNTDEAWGQNKDKPLAPEQRAAITEMLGAREEGKAAYERYYDDPLDDRDELRAALGLPRSSRVVSLFTNLTWDSSVVGRDIAYPSMLDWIADAVEVVSGLEDVVLVIRVHPGESKWGTKQPVGESLGELPPNVRLIGPEEALSSYALLDLSDLVLSYATTVGLEAATRGIPVATAADTHYRGRGFTTDLETPADLRELLAAPTWEITAEQVERALAYAFLFFFRCMIPLSVIPLDQGIPARVPGDAAEIAPGANPYLDFICDRILDGGAFTLPEEMALPG